MDVSKHEIDGAIETLLRLDPIKRSAIIWDLAARTVSELAERREQIETRKAELSCPK